MTLLNTVNWEGPNDCADTTFPPSPWRKDTATFPASANREPAARCSTPGEPVRAGQRSVRFELRKGDDDPCKGIPPPCGPPGGSTRAELEQTGFDNWAPVPSERWYGFSIYLPGTWTSDTSAEIVTQWHQQSPIGGSPPLAIMTRDGKWVILQSWTGNSDGTETKVGDYVTGRWTDWVVHVKWAADSSGLLEIWKDGKLVHPFEHKAGTNTYDVEPGNEYTYMKIGIYKWDWAQNNPSITTSRVMYHDEVRIADGPNDYDVVAPEGPGATLYRDGRLVVFARGTDGTIWHRWQLTPNGDWSAGWGSIGAPSNRATSGPAATLNAPGGLVAFARGQDGAIWHAWQDHMDGDWSGWASLGGEWTSAPGATLYRDGRLVVFARGTDGAIWHRWQLTPNGDWSADWGSIGAPPNGAASGPAATLNQPGGLVAFVRGQDGAIWHAWQDQMDGDWSAWASLDKVELRRSKQR